MACNCARRAKHFALRVLGFVAAGPEDAPVFVLMTDAGAASFTTDQYERHHFRITLISVLLRLVLGRPTVKETP